MSLRYPLGMGEGGEPRDYITFQSTPYRPNMHGGSASAPAGSGSPLITLYMPTEQPPDTQSNIWADSGDSFAGPIGKAKRQAMSFVLNKAVGNSNFNTPLPDIDPEAFAIDAMSRKAAQVTNTSRNGILALSSGKVYNPNIEMLYNGIGLRSFLFNFNLVAYDSDEVIQINSIVKEFKKWSAPEITGEFMEVPHLWNISYKGPGAPYLNRFKKCVLTSVSVRNNENIKMHMTFEGGAPIDTSIALSFTETQIVGRKDHEAHLRGF